MSIVLTKIASDLNSDVYAILNAVRPKSFWPSPRWFGQGSAAKRWRPAVARPTMPQPMMATSKEACFPVLAEAMLSWLSAVELILALRAER